MKIRITSNPITPYGSFSRGDILTDEKYPLAFLHHLVTAAGAAELVDLEPYETKVEEVAEIKKKPPFSQSLPQDKASPKKTRGRPRKTHK